MLTKRYLGLALCAACFTISSLLSQNITVNLQPSQDNSIYEGTAWEANSSGAGQHLYSGSISQMRARRALLGFDLSSIPAGATINSVALTITVSRARGASIPFNLFRLTSDWGEGSSTAGSIGGQGVAAANGDATWLCSFFGTGSCQTAWTTVGGDFVNTVSSSVNIGGNGQYTFPSTPQLVADVQDWVDGSTNNFGWVLRSAETISRNARRINSRENAINPPTLTINYSTVVPVELADFSGELRGNFHNLQWKTASEVNFSHFVLERSVDQGLSFDELTRVNGNGQEAAGADYQFTVPAPVVNTSLYRLRMVDIDGTNSLSPIVRLRKAEGNTGIVVWPNPVVDQLNFTTSNDEALIGISIIAVNGQVVQTISSTQVAQGVIPVNNLPNGLYTLRLAFVDEITNQRFVKTGR